jgi:hypothetical protein
MALNSVPYMKHQAAGLFEILDPDIGNALVKD